MKTIEVSAIMSKRTEFGCPLAFTPGGDLYYKPGKSWLMLCSQRHFKFAIERWNEEESKGSRVWRGIFKIKVGDE